MSVIWAPDIHGASGATGYDRPVFSFYGVSRKGDEIE